MNAVTAQDFIAHVLVDDPCLQVSLAMYRKTGEEMSWEGDQELQCDLTAAVQNLIAQTGNNQRVLECYYWSQEPGLLELIRAFLAMPADAQTALRMFLAAAVVRSSITASIDETGALTFRSPEAASLLASLFGHDSPVLPRYLV